MLYWKYKEESCLILLRSRVQLSGLCHIWSVSGHLSPLTLLSLSSHRSACNQCNSSHLFSSLQKQVCQSSSPATLSVYLISAHRLSSSFHQTRPSCMNLFLDLTLRSASDPARHRGYSGLWVVSLSTLDLDFGHGYQCVSLSFTCDFLASYTRLNLPVHFFEYLPSRDLCWSSTVPVNRGSEPLLTSPPPGYRTRSVFPQITSSPQMFVIGHFANYIAAVILISLLISFCVQIPHITPTSPAFHCCSSFCPHCRHLHLTLLFK